jgi:citrate lyase subunit beta/citryl-CoA lyase
MVMFSRRRSSLVVPGSSEKMVSKASNLDADEIIFDLEDAVAPADKLTARNTVVEALNSGQFESKTVSIRTNLPGTKLFNDDISAIANVVHLLDTLVIPKVEAAEDLVSVSVFLSEIEQARVQSPVGLQALIETAKGVAHVVEIAGSTERLQSLILGYADLASSLGRTKSFGQSWHYVQESVLVAARSAGVQAIDGPYFSIGDDKASILGIECKRLFDSGFDGKWAIHPSQIRILNTSFTPSQSEIAYAQEILNALEVSASASALNGEMIDEAMRLGALRTLSKLDVQR